MEIGLENTRAKSLALRIAFISVSLAKSACISDGNNNDDWATVSIYSLFFCMHGSV